MDFKMPPSLVLAPQEDPLIGQTLGNFLIEEKIARGGFGAVYRAVHTILEQPCAIKVLHLYQKDPETEARFKREARALAQLHHANVVRMNDFGMLPTGGFYLAMELLEGKTLYQRFRENEQFSLPRIKDICTQLCEVLAYISNKGVVHRDLKPGNIFLCVDEDGKEQIKLIDFGIVTLLYSPEELTQTGAYVGTAKYGSPEQIRGERNLDVRSDLYALGVLLYRLLAGRVPFVGQGNSVLTIIQQQVFERPPPLTEVMPHRRWAPALEAFLQKSLAKNPIERFATPAEFSEAFLVAIAAQEALEASASALDEGDMTVLDPLWDHEGDRTTPYAGLPLEVRKALMQAQSTEEKKGILFQLYQQSNEKSSASLSVTIEPPSQEGAVPLGLSDLFDEDSSQESAAHVENNRPEATVPQAPNPLFGVGGLDHSQPLHPLLMPPPPSFEVPPANGGANELSEPPDFSADTGKDTVHSGFLGPSSLESSLDGPIDRTQVVGQTKTPDPIGDLLSQQEVRWSRPSSESSPLWVWGSLAAGVVLVLMWFLLR